MELKPQLLACLYGEAENQEVLLKATNRRGKAMVGKITSPPLTSRGEGVRGAILWVEEQEAEAGEGPPWT